MLGGYYYGDATVGLVVCRHEALIMPPENRWRQQPAAAVLFAASPSKEAKPRSNRRGTTQNRKKDEVKETRACNSR